MADTKNLSVIKQETIDAIEKRVQDLQSKGEINLPANYSASNALKSAYLILQDTKDKDGKLALEICTRESIQNALFNMVLLALSPAKKQVYAIVRGNKLCMDTSYFGIVAATKRIKGVVDVFAQVIYQGDIFEYEIRQGSKKVIKHEQKIENVDITKITGAYCTVIYKDIDGTQKEYTEVMSKAQIDAAWKKTSMRTNSVQQEFAEEMAKRTVIKRTCKLFVNTSDDSDLIIEAYNATSEAEYDKEQDVSAEIKEKANKEDIKVDYTVAEEEAAPTSEPIPEPNNQSDPEAEANTRRRNF